MFQIYIFLLSHVQESGKGQVICSYMDLSYEGSCTRLTIALSKYIVELIADKLEPEASQHSQELIQDVVCEITTIVGNHLRSYVSDKMGFTPDIGLPIPGLPKSSEQTTPVINLHFRIMEHDGLKLDLSYANKEQTAIV
jgi:hypothetical protein